MNTNNQERKAIFQVKGIQETSEARRRLRDYFGEGDVTQATETPAMNTENLKLYLEAEAKKHVAQFLEQQQQELDQKKQEQQIQKEVHEMEMRERRASINTSNAVTGVMVTWAVAGMAMLAKSCINFDKGPKFKV